jgi:DNA adenine methylase
MQRFHNSQTRSPLSWFGGKALLRRFILPYFPSHTRYCEVFGGSLALFFAKPPAAEEIVNDLDPGVANFWRVLKDVRKSEQLCRALRYTLNSRQEHNECKRTYPVADDVEWARQFFVLTRQSMSAIFAASWGYTIQTPARGFESSVELLPAAMSRLRQATVENLDYTQMFARYDGADVLWYLDPPYLGSTRISEQVYQHDMPGREQHEQLLSHMTQLKGMVLLSGYPSPLYNRALGDWLRVDHAARCYAGNHKDRAGCLTRSARTECLWINPAAARRLRRQGRIIP